MRFVARHRLAAPPGPVAEALCDPDFYAALRLPDLAPAVVLGVSEEDHETVVRLHSTYIGRLDPVAARLLSGSTLTWTQEVRVDRSAARGRILFAAAHDPARLHGAADFRLAPAGTGTLRVLEGDLVVAVALIGPLAERRIVPGLLSRLALEAEALDARLARG